MGKYKAYCEKLGTVKTFHNGTNPGNQQRRFHGTKMKCDFNGQPCGQQECNACSIISKGWSMQYCKPGGAFFGVGMYCTSSSSASSRYAKQGYHFNGAILVAGVACGKPEVLEGKNLIDNALVDQ